MFQPKKINPDLVLIKIDRKLQASKREKIGSIYIPLAHRHMSYNQQNGEIVLIGKSAQQRYPGMRSGDRLYFHHSVEGNLMPVLDQQRMNQKMESSISYEVYNNEHSGDPYVYYTVKPDFIYAYKNSLGEIFTNPEMVLAIDHAPDKKELKQQGSLFVFENYKESRADVQKRIDAMKMECETHPERAALIMPEMEKLTKSLSKKVILPFVPIFIPESLNEHLGFEINHEWLVYYMFIGSKSLVAQITTTEIEGHSFYVLRMNFIWAVAPASISVSTQTLQQSPAG